MTSYEYKVVPAPKRAKAVKGVRKPEERFALMLTELMNELGAEGWEYLRADALPVEQRSGLTSKVTVYQNVLIFRRATEAAEEGPLELPAPAEPRLKASLGSIGPKPEEPAIRALPEDESTEHAAE